MRALQVTALSSDFSGCSLKEVATPEIGPGQILVRVEAASLNFPDLLMAQGLYQFKPELPFILGMEVAGTVERVGSPCAFKVGDAVVGTTRVGGFARYVAVDAHVLRPKPANVSFAQAAAFGIAYLTAYVALVRLGNLQRNQWLLVHGASGGVGLAAVDLGKALGARVIAASGSPEKLDAIAARYAPDAILDTSKPFRDEVKALTNGGADCIYDPVGGDIFDESTRCIAFGGKLLVVGFASGRIPVISANMPLIKGFSVVGVRAGEFGRRFPELGHENLDAIWQMAAEGRLTPYVHCELPLGEWREALRLMSERKVTGKIVLRPE
ncbi:NADPH:quinone oxidoreductase family protein [Sphingobium sp. AN558]|uniref:NADPH:quinone oxidoreductase family protein n=1 Tax=Sphingobium sp. AN558 TaxID=3133442 RepID=UPI0030C61057